MLNDYSNRKSELESLSSTIKNIIESLGGMKSTVVSGEKVEIKETPVSSINIEEKEIEIPKRPETEELIPCPNCGTLISKDAIMCYACGYVLHPELLDQESKK